jgi:hypothetical protein
MSEQKMAERDATDDGAVGGRVHARREFMRLALSVVPVAGVLTSCVTAPDGAIEGTADDPVVATEHAELLNDCPKGNQQQHRSRWVQLHDEHIGYENLHDLPGIAQSFGNDATMIVNDRVFADAKSIADGHVLFGMSSQTSGLSGTQVIPDREFFTDNELLIHGRVTGQHVGQVLHFPPTFRQVELHYAAFYRFDQAGKLVSERIVMNWAPLAGA